MTKILSPDNIKYRPPYREIGPYTLLRRLKISTTILKSNLVYFTKTKDNHLPRNAILRNEATDINRWGRKLYLTNKNCFYRTLSGFCVLSLYFLASTTLFLVSQLLDELMYPVKKICSYSY